MEKDKNYEGKLIAEIQNLAQFQGLNTVFTTFLEITATSIAAQMDPEHTEERKQRYKKIISTMTPETLNSYARMLAQLWMATREHKDEPCDILGDIYHKLRLNNEWNGQFFSPDNICRMMAIMVNPVYEDLNHNGPVIINEPACGSGAMILVWAMKQQGFDYQHKSFFVVQDMDIRCIWMAYIQLSLYRVPAVLIHGNTLSMEEWDRWYTPYAVVPFVECEEMMGT